MTMKKKMSMLAFSMSKGLSLLKNALMQSSGVLGGRSLDSLMAQAWTRREARQLCGYATEQTTK